MASKIEELYAFMDGRTMVIDGIEGTIKYEARPVRYPYNRVEHKLFHTATEAGKATEAYQACKRLLGDDWDLDLLMSDSGFDALCAEAERLGFVWSNAQTGSESHGSA